jgi:chaperonin GroEL
MTDRLMSSDLAREAILTGANALADQIKLTLGPKGRPVVIEKGFGSPIITSDGVTVARETRISDAVANMGAQMVREVATTTSDIAGDGTTTAAVLAQVIYADGTKAIAEGRNPVALKRGIERALVVVMEELRQLSRVLGAEEAVEVTAKTMDLPSLYERTLKEGIPKLTAEVFVQIYRRISAEKHDMSLVERLTFASREARLGRELTDYIINKILRSYTDLVTKSTLLQKTMPYGLRVDAIATLFAGNDSAIGKIVADAITRVGKNGVIVTEESRSLDIGLEFVRGVTFDRGFLSPYFATDPDAGVFLQDAYILVHEKQISSLKAILPLLEQVAESGRPLLVIAEDVVGEALATLVVNKLREKLMGCAVKAPSSGQNRRALLKDIAVLTGGTAITEDLGVKLENVQISDLGQAKKVTVDRHSTTIIEGQGGAAEIEQRAKDVRRQIETASDDHDREMLQERLASLVGGVAVIKVGAATEAEAKEKKTRVKDAIRATRAALDEGVVPGGGVALARSVKALEALDVEGDERAGVDIMKHAVTEPLRLIAESAGEEGAAALGKVLASKDQHFGFNAQNGKFEDLVRAGVVDTTKVVGAAVETATSIAVVMLTTEAWVSEIPEEKKAPMPGGQGGGMGDMY